MVKSYKDLVVWQKSYNLSLSVYKVTHKYPRSETYTLVSQMRRSAISIPSNIAEGYCRQGKREYVQFLKIAFASGAELETQLLISKDLEFLKIEEFDSIYAVLQEVMKMLNSLIRKIKSSA